MELYERLEEKLSEWAQVPREGMVVCSSGTAALHLAFEAIQLPQGSEVICPDFTMVACPRAIALAGLTPVFVDCGEDALLNPHRDFLPYVLSDLARAAIGLLAVHIYGRRCDMEAYHDFATAYPLANERPMYVVEDMAELHGVAPFPRSDAACWSMYRNKVLAGEEGGAVWFKDPARASIARELRSMGFRHGPRLSNGVSIHDYTHRPRGHNYRMSNTHAGLILDCLRVFQDRCCDRRRAEITYDGMFPEEWKMPPRDKVWVYDFRVRGLNEVQQWLVVRALNDEGIPARHGFKPMSSQEEFRNCKLLKREGESVANILSREVIYLPAVGVTEESARKCLTIIQKCLVK